MASNPSKKRPNITPDTSSTDSFPILCEDIASTETDDVVVRAVKKRKLEEAGGKKSRSIFDEDSQDTIASLPASILSTPESPPHTLAKITASGTVILDETPSLIMLDKQPSNQRSSSNLDILTDPIFAFPQGPIKQDSIPIDLFYDIDDED